MFGKHHTQKSKDKMSRNRKGKSTGENNPNYVHGRAYEPYTSEFNNQLRESIRKRDGYRCQKCGCSEIENRTKLTVHHIDYNKKNCGRKNLTTLCHKCNGKVNQNRKKWVRYFQRKMEKGHVYSQLCLAKK